MSRDLELLEPGFRETVRDQLLPKCLERGVEMRPFFTRRTPWEQARLWRQSRTTWEINTAAEKIKVNGAPFLAKVLLEVGPQYGQWATNALPGQSWHQWGLAVDCFVVASGGGAIWDANHHGYRVYAEVAGDLGLEAGRTWRKVDACHVQEPGVCSVMNVYTWPEIDAAMREKFGEVEPHVS